MRESGKLIASGRDADVFECGPGLVMRRSRHARSMEIEARVMEHARAHGYPVPAVEELSHDGSTMVMERIEGSPMIDVLGRRPWSGQAFGEVLGDLHEQLHNIPAPDGLPLGPSGAGDTLLHLDLHPLNVILSPAGPVVIDWTNARAGVGEEDVALTWVILAAATSPTRGPKRLIEGAIRRRLVDGMLAKFDRAAVAAHVAAVVDWKVTDRNMSDVERVAMRDLAARIGAG